MLWLMVWLIAGGILLLGLATIAGIAIWVAHQITLVDRVPVYDHPIRHGLAYEDVEFLSRYDHIPLRGWYLPATPDTRCIIMLQGELHHRNSPGIGALELARDLVQQGFSVLLYDYRGRGESGGTRSSAGDREQWGALGALDYVNSRSIPTTRIGLLGFSLGAGVAILVAAQVKDIPAVVADSAFVDWLRDLERLSLHGVVLPRWFIGPIVIVGRLWFRTNVANVRPVMAVPHIAPRPVLFIHGAEDTVIPPGETLELYHAASNRENIVWIVPGAGHVKAYLRRRAEYVARVADFFQRHIPFSGSLPNES
jgi:fermentation-respiration switch protein FrsA (DUF1100 family)